MGQRAQVLIEDEGVYLYTHNGSHALADVVARALDRAPMLWEDPEYLARVIFDEMTSGHRGMYGYGIGTHVHCDLDYEPIVVNCQAGTVTYRDTTLPFREFVNSRA